MEFSEDSADRTLVFKGKRSKRPRQSSLVAVTSTSSTGGGGGGGGSSDDTSTTQISNSSSTTEEDEDMANCLILLAQSGYRKLQVEKNEHKKEKFSSRKFAEMATISTGKAGFYVYECKTCNRTFPSFQALGGHRTSHKKAKTIVELEKKLPTTENSISVASGDRDQHHQQEEKFNSNNNNIITPAQIVNRENYSNSDLNNKGKAKVHECSICGAEFSSGQALGGHMRRHRPPTMITASTNNGTNKVSMSTTFETSNNNTSESASHDDDDEIKEKPRIFLSLDLNLPAPPEDDHHRDTGKFVFSAAALVDCHY